MIRFALLLLALVLTPPVMAAPAPGAAFDIVEGLTTEVGQRLAGTEAEARARAWGAAKLKALGFSNVRIETYDMPVWVRGAETAEIISPFPQKMVVTALGNSGSTGDAGLTLPVVGFESLAALKAADPASVKGKIVFVSHAMKAAQDGSGYGPFGGARRQGPSIASKMGAAAIVVRSIGTDHSRAPHTGVQIWQDGAMPIPAGALSIADAENLQRMLARGKPVMMKLILTPRQIDMQQSGNVIAEVPGSDPAAGLVVIGGHLDSWDLGTGAIDDGAGLAITTAAAKAILDSGKKPRRTIRVVWWGAEEVGSFGGRDYFTRHKAEPHAFAAESDFGADRVWRLDVKLPDSVAAVRERLATAMAPLGIPVGKEVAGGGADVEALLASGVHGADLQQDGLRYFDWHHTPEDTLDKIDPAQLQQNVDAWTAMLTVIANAPEDLLGSQIKK
ncbi:MAG: M20/M25/M40 family metallo-hydrolase [Sphingomonadaceae bacterium]